MYVCLCLEGCGYTVEIHVYLQITFVCWIRLSRDFGRFVHFSYFFFPLFNIYARRFRNEDFTHRRGRYKLMFLPFFFFPFLAAIQNTQRIDLYAGLYQDSRASLSLVRLYNIIQKSNCVEREIIGWTNWRLVCASSFFFSFTRASESRSFTRQTPIYCDRVCLFFFYVANATEFVADLLADFFLFCVSLSPSLFTFFFGVTWTDDRSVTVPSSPMVPP